MADYIDFLAAQAALDAPPVTAELDAALAALDAEFESLAPELQIEFIGPGVGMADMRAEHVFRLVIRHHVWDVDTEGWGLKVCDALPNCDFRPMWPVQGVGRLRKRQLLTVLPEFMTGYAGVVAEAGKADTPAGRRVMEMARAFTSA